MLPNGFFEVWGGSWYIRRDAPHEVSIRLSNGASQFINRFDLFNTPGLYQMVDFLFGREVKPDVPTSEQIHFGEADNDSYNLPVDSSITFCLRESGE